MKGMPGVVLRHSAISRACRALAPVASSSIQTFHPLLFNGDGRNSEAPPFSTAASMSGETSSLKLKYFSAWFCPFAHRATLALEHHQIPYQWEEALGWEKRAPSGDEEFSASERPDWWYHWKSPGLLAANPQGMVPTILDETTGRAVCESLVCIEFIDELAASRARIGPHGGDGGGGGGVGSAGSKPGMSAPPPLLPSCPFERARARLAADAVNKSVTSAYYSVLVRTDAEERRQAFKKLLNGLRSFVRGSRGDFWGGETLGYVDCVLLPYAYRLYAIEHYRGTDFAVPTSGEEGLWERYHAWLTRATALEYVVGTLPEKQRYLRHVAKYAEGRARSKVGNAVRRGAAAHEYDDAIDGDKH